MTPTRTEAGLLAAVVAEPGSDLPRLVYADFLEDRDGPGDRARAEFVRVQCAAEKVRAACLCGDCVRRRGSGQHHNGRCALDRDHRHLRRRERELLERNPRWYVLPPGGPITTELCRGFVESVRLPLAVWLEHGPEMVRAAPLARVELADQRPFTSSVDGAAVWDWFSTYFPVDDTAPGPAVLPNRVFVLLEPGPRKNHYGKEYDSREGALADASAALLAFARSPR